MATLHVALQEGFAQDSVQVRVNGVEAYQEANLSTRNQIGLAGSFAVETTAEDAELEVIISSRGTQLSQRVNVASAPFVGISLQADGTPQIATRNEPFGYV